MVLKQGIGGIATRLIGGIVTCHCDNRSYDSRLRPCMDRDQRVWIQKLSGYFLQVELAKHICSMIIIVRSPNVWPGMLIRNPIGLSESFQW